MAGRLRQVLRVLRAERLPQAEPLRLLAVLLQQEEQRLRAGQLLVLQAGRRRAQQPDR